MQFINNDQMGGQRWHCAVTGRSTDPVGMFDCRVPLVLHSTDNKPHTTEYRTTISHAAATEMARVLGWHPPDKVEEIEAMLREYAAKIASLEQYVEKLEQFKALEAELAEVPA